jgi:hypothetical protein
MFYQQHAQQNGEARSTVSYSGFTQEKVGILLPKRMGKKKIPKSPAFTSIILVI